MAINIGRRKFIGGLVGTTLWPLTARAAGGRPRIGYLDINSAASNAQHLVAFRDGLQRLGYIEGRTVDIDYRYADGDTEKLAALAQELALLKPDVVLASAVSPTRAMKRIAPALPIVCPAFSDSFVPSLAASLAHPGGSVTGIASDVEGTFGKLTEVTLDAIPGTAKIGFLANPAGGSMKRFEQQVQTAANARGVEVQIEEVKTIDDFEGAFQRLSQGNVRAVIIPENGLLNSRRKRIFELSLPLRLPLIFADRSGVEAGGLVSYGVNISENFSRAAAYVDKILKGSAPGDLPIEFPTRLELVVNLKTAKALGLTVPPALVSRADDAIE
jgi:putative tryptophan/tyrosine transport system substrate-binding protein